MNKIQTLSYLRTLSFIFLLCLFGKITLAQDCPYLNSNLNLEGNNISANISNSGNLFFDWPTGGQFTLANDSNQSPLSLIFASGLWLGAENETGQLKVAAAQYNASYEHDYAAGPILNENGQITYTCEDYDKIWQVFGHEILNHLADFQDNGMVENPISNIYSYPALGNPHFENLNGFSLPDAPHGYAPFHDENNNGLYNPDNGDFPLPTSVDESRIPNHLLWGIFSDGGINHTSSGGDRLNAEIQLTAWSFDCTEDDLLRNTIFTSYKITNQGNEDLDSLKVGLFTDFDIGCYTDDYLGSAPELNTFYGYNADSLDGTTGCICNGGVPTFCDAPPAQAITFLNQEMSTFTYFHQGVVINAPAITSPQLPQGYYNYLNGKWADGTPFTEGGSGYGGTQPTNFAYSGNPNDTSAWSLISTTPILDSRFGVGSVSVGDFARGESVIVDLAFSTHVDETLNHLEIVDKMYEQIPLLQQNYNNGFTDGCTQDIWLVNDENLEKNTVSIFPNPASDFLNVHFENATSASFTVFDLYGNVLLQKKESTQEHAQIAISDFPQGIYFLKIQMDGKEVVQKFLKH